MLGFDEHSLLTAAEPEALNFRLLPGSPAANAGTTATLEASDVRPATRHDFHGNERPSPPSCGAFEVIRPFVGVPTVPERP